MSDQFLYPEMTPELQEYLELLGKHPGYEYPTQNSGTPTPESNAAVEAWRALCASKHAPLNGAAERYYQARKEWHCRDETQVKTTDYPSPSGKYLLRVTQHRTGEGFWPYTKGLVYKLVQGLPPTLLTTIYRNYATFPFLWVEGHTSGHDYLVCGETYMGHTVVCLDLATKVNEQHDFCWAKYNLSPSGHTLAVSGCYWGCPSEVWFYDFTNPLANPLPVLHREDAEGVFEWKDGEPDTCLYGNTYQVCTVYGKREFELTDDELKEADRLETSGQTVWEDRKEVFTWKR